MNMLLNYVLGAGKFIVIKQFCTKVSEEVSGTFVSEIKQKTS